jgi:hypothetical protein
MMRVPRLLSVHVIYEPLKSIAWQATAISSVFQFTETPRESFSFRTSFIFYRDAKIPRRFSLPWPLNLGFLHKNHNYR